MIFLIHYERASSRLVSIADFERTEEANVARAELEITLLGCNGTHEVVLLEADSLDALKKTHSRYFSSWDELAKKRST